MKTKLTFLTAMLLGQVILSAGVASPAMAEEQLFIPSPLDEFSTGPELALPEIPDAPSSDGEMTHSAGESVDVPLEPIAAGEPDDFGLFDENQEYQMFDSRPALLESTGTWLRRGHWFAEVDMVVFNRQIGRGGFGLMNQTVGMGVDSVGRTVLRNNFLLIGGNGSGVEGMPRIKLGRFLFRDIHNRDHTAEFTIYGGGQWSQQSSLRAVTGTSQLATLEDKAFPETLQVPGSLDRGNPSFDGATSSQYSYESQFNSFELNYHVKRRMQNDRMAMRPDGEWVRVATPTRTRSLIAGVRYFGMTDNLAWDAFEVPGPTSTATGNYRVRTDNKMFGFQLGFTQAHETSRWSIEFLAKAGGYVNRVDVDSTFSGTTTLTSGKTHLRGDTLAFLSEVQFLGKWHLRPNFSLRAGIELLYVDALALAPNQIDFLPGGSTKMVNSNNNLYLGLSTGFEGYW